MACRGIYYAITSQEAEKLLALAGSDDDLSDAVHGLYSEERERAGFQASMDKAWDAMHRCLTDGTLSDVGEGITPLSWFVLGARNLYEGTSYIICYVAPEQVQSILQAAGAVTRDWFHGRYFGLDPNQYDGPIEDQDFEYTWAYFEDARKLYENAAVAGRAMIFETDQ